jgi:hypothetical protein
MNVVTSRIDLKTTRANWPRDMAFAPALVKAKQPGQPEDWYAIDAKLELDQPPSFADTRHDQYLRVPLFEYVLSPEADLAFAHVVQLVLSCAGYIGRPIKTLHIVTGNPVDLIYADSINTASGLRYWFGIAFSLERQQNV